MTWLRQKIAPAPHLLEPKDTMVNAKAYWLAEGRFSASHLTTAIAEHERALEHEQAILEGMYQALESLHGQTVHCRA